MMKHTKRLLLFAIMLLFSGVPLKAQTVIGGNDGYDLDYLTPKTYEIGGISYEGADNFDTRVIQLVAGLQVGDNIRVPGDKISAAIENLWKQGMFEDVQIRVNRIQGNIIFLKIVLKERPRMDKFAFTGVKKGEADKLREEIKIANGEVVTENMLRTSVNKIKGYYIDKGYTRVEVTPTTEQDSNGRVTVTFNVKRGNVVKIDSLIFEGNEQVKTLKLQSKMEKTHDVHYFWNLLFWTKGFWKKSRYIENDFREDLDKVIAYYNEEGFRDARVISDTVWDVPQGESTKDNRDMLKVKVKIYEGQRYFFRNITFSGNTVYSDELLHRALRINKGDPYNKKELDMNISYNPSGTDITSLYMDNGYLFFRATPVEVAVENDSIDIEIRIVEGKQARIRNVSVEGNTITNDKVIMRELHTRPGDLFSRDAVLRSRRELVTLGYFKEEKIEPVPKPNAEDGTVDIVYKVEEGSTSQLNLQGGYGGGMVIGQIGVQLNNFSLRNIFNKDAWVPLPAGDGQKLGINAVTNGTHYYSISASFTEPWLGGHRPQSLTGSVYHNLYSNGFYYSKDDANYYSLKITGAGVSFSKRLKWPDDYFIVSHGISFKHYTLDNYSLNTDIFTDGVANDLSYGFTLSRNSLDSPIYARSGSEVTVSAYVTPPYSIISGKTEFATKQEKYKWVEYYKVNLRGSWMVNLVGDVVLNTRFRFGFMSYYNDKIGLAPFGRYFLGGDGLSSWMLDGREVVPLRGYENNSLGASTNGGGAVFDRFTLELRQPIIESNTATIWLAGYVEGGNCWSDISEFQPFKMYNSAGVGVRLFMPIFGLIGVDWGYGFDGVAGGSHFHFSIGQSLD